MQFDDEEFKVLLARAQEAEERMQTYAKMALKLRTQRDYLIAEIEKATTGCCDDPVKGRRILESAIQRVRA